MGSFQSHLIPRKTVLEAYTQGSAFAESAEQQKGTLEVGKLADLAVWDCDLFSVLKQNVRSASVTHTILGGCIVYGTVP